MNNKTVAELIEKLNDDEIIEINYNVTIGDNTFDYQVTLTNEGLSNYLVYNPQKGYNKNYFTGWSLEPSKESEELEIAYDTLRHMNNNDVIIDFIYNTAEGETSKILLEQNKYYEGELKYVNPADVNTYVIAVFAVESIEIL